MSAQTKGGWPLNRGKKINDFLMVIVASGIARGRVQTTVATKAAVESCKMAALVYCVLL